MWTLLLWFPWEVLVSSLFSFTFKIRFFNLYFLFLTIFKSVWGTMVFSLSPCLPSTIPSVIISIRQGTYFSKRRFNSILSCWRKKRTRIHPIESWFVKAKLSINTWLTKYNCSCRNHFYQWQGTVTWRNFTLLYGLGFHQVIWIHQMIATKLSYLSSLWTWVFNINVRNKDLSNLI